MNTEQRQDLLNAIAEFKKTDFDTPFKERYKDSVSIDSIRFGDYPIEELFITAKKSVFLLENFLKKDTWQPLQNSIVISSYNNSTLANIVKRITSHFKSADYDQAAIETNRLVHYEMQNGFWNKTKRTGSVINIATFEAVDKKSKLTLEHINARGKKIESLINDLEDAKSKFDELVKTQSQEINTIRTNQTQTSDILTEMKCIQERASATKQAIDALNKKADDIITELETSQEGIEEQIKTNNNKKITFITKKNH